MQNAKRYQDYDVLTAATSRYNQIFDEFENVCISVSGGKDSGVCLYLAADIARSRGRKIDILVIDIEAVYRATAEFLVEALTKCSDVINRQWYVCLPMTSPNPASFHEPYWVWWEKDAESSWIRPIPTNSTLTVITEDNHEFPFYRKHMSFEDFVAEFTEWYGENNIKAGQVIGLRASESYKRYLTIVGDVTANRYKGWRWSTSPSGKCFKLYPIYDWMVEDVWRYYAKTEYPYNKLYDLMYQAGVSLSVMRVDEPMSEECSNSLRMFKVLEPFTWVKVVNRVSGMNCSNLYSNSSLMGAKKYDLPVGHNWKSFTLFLLSTLPRETSVIYRRKFTKYIKVWCEQGAVVEPDYLDLLETNYKSLIKKIAVSTRSVKGSTAVMFHKLPDRIEEVGDGVEIGSWYRLARTIIINDIVCKKLGFSMNTDLMKYQRELINSIDKRSN